MKLHYKLLLLSLFSLSILNSCEYQLEGLNEPKVNKEVTPPEIQIIQLSLNDDTLFLYNNSEIRFNFSSIGNQKIIKTIFYLNGSEFQAINSNQGSFPVYYSQFLNGVNKIKIEIYTTSGTGSIADKLQVEGFKLSFYKEWLIKTNHNYNSYNINTSEINGYLQLTWPKCLSGDFKEFRINLWDGRTEVTNGTNIIDSSYAGQGRYYTVSVFTKSGYEYPWASCTKSAEIPLLQKNTKNGYKVIWNKSKYYKSIEKYVLSYSSSDYPYSQGIVKETIDPTDTVFVIAPFVFGRHMTYELGIVPSNKKISCLYKSILYFGQIGDESPNFSNFFTLDNDKFLFISYTNKICRYSISQNRIIEEKDMQPTSCTNSTGSDLNAVYVSPKGKYYSGNINCNSIVLGDCSNLTSYTVNNYPLYYQYLQVNPITDIGTGILKNNVNNNLVIYDYINNSVLGELMLSYFSIAKSSLSSNGDYLVVPTFNSVYTTNLYHFYQNKFTLIQQINTSEISYLKFSANDPNQIAIAINGIFYLKQCNDFSTLAEFNLNEEKLIDIDFYNNKILTLKNYILYVRNMTSGDKIVEIPVQNTLIDYSIEPELHLLNNVIFYNGGICHRL